MRITISNHALRLGDYQLCKVKFKLRELISCFCCAQTSHADLEADSRGSGRTQTGSELSQLKFEFTGLVTTVDSRNL